MSAPWVNEKDIEAAPYFGRGQAMSSDEALIKANVHLFSIRVFGMPYEQVAKFIYPKPKYQHFSLQKKSGGLRAIEAPFNTLKQLQRNLLNHIRLIAHPAKSCVHGFEAGRSIVSNAQAHCDTKTTFVLNIDLENFFPTISFYRVRGVFCARPFNYSFQVATVIAHLCCFDGRLAQGAPTSPFISNIICRNLDKTFQSLAKRNRVTYTRYCDDLTFSFKNPSAEKLPPEFCTFDGDNLFLGEEIINIIKENGFSINNNKTRINSKYCRQEITGLTVNEFPNVRRRFIDQIRGALHGWEKYGYDAAHKAWLARTYRRELRSKSPPSLMMNLYGRLLYLKMVRGVDDEIYCRLAHRFNAQLDDPELPFPSPPRKLPTEFIVCSASGARNAVFVLEAEWGMGEEIFTCSRQGTAFAIGDDYLVTCDHVVTEVLSPDEKNFGCVTTVGTDRHKIKGPGGDSHRVSVIASDKQLDVALLKLTDSKPAGLRVMKFSPIEASPDQDTILLGFPNWNPGRPLNSVKGHVTSVFAKQAIRRLETSQSIRQGNSGGPLIGKDFRVLGMATEGAILDKGNNECLLSTEIIIWLRENFSDLKII